MIPGYQNRLQMMGMPLPNASPLTPVQYSPQAGGVSLMPIPAAGPEPKSLMSALGGQQGGIGSLMTMLKAKDDAAKKPTPGGPVPGIALPMDIQNTIGQQIAAASYPNPGIQMGPSITGEMVPGGGQMGWMDWLRQSPMTGWFGGFGG